MTLEALREKVGGATFFRILRDWVDAHRYGNATTREFIDLAEADSGADLGHFLHAWLLWGKRPHSARASRRSTHDSRRDEPPERYRGASTMAGE